jgi:hypothetical protein
MDFVSWWLRSIAFMLVGVSLLGCASTQLNYNTLDIASTVDSLVTSQVLSNLAKFEDSPNAIPSQIVFPAGTVTTNNSINTSAAIPISALSTVTNTIATAASKTVTNTSTTTMNNTTETFGATNTGTQTWNVAPVTDPDQIRRLRILYQYATDQADDRDLLCNYPLISKKQDTSSQPAAAGQPNPTAITYDTDKGHQITVHFGAPKPPNPGANKPKKYWVNCTRPPEAEDKTRAESNAAVKETATYRSFTNPDPAFLQPPSCLLCDDPSFATSSHGENSHEDKYKCNTSKNKNAAFTNSLAYQADKDEQNKADNTCLYINRRLQQNWLKKATNLFEIPSGAIYLGHYQREYVGLVRQDYYFYVLGKNEKDTLRDLNSFYEFALFVLEATATSATSATPVYIAGAVSAR